MIMDIGIIEIKILICVELTKNMKQKKRKTQKVVEHKQSKEILP